MAKRKADALFPIELAAVAELAKLLERDDLPDGNGQPVDFTVRLFGGVNVGAPDSYESSVKPDLVDVLAITLQCVGDRKVKEITAALNGAYGKLPADQAPKIDDENLRKEAAEIVAACTRKRTIDRRGRISSSLQHELVTRA